MVRGFNTRACQTLLEKALMQPLHNTSANISLLVSLPHQNGVQALLKSSFDVIFNDEETASLCRLLHRLAALAAAWRNA
jgi:tRNA A37 threonylcarbamoyladenosine synthetase subunit TsaC/SUA5/YrdC